MDIGRYNEDVQDVYRNEGDAILDKAIDNLTNYKAHHNRKYVYEPSEEGFKRFQADTEKYFAWVRNANRNLEDGRKPIIPDVEGWATSLSLTRVTIFRYHKDRGEPWTSYIDYVRETLISIKKQYGLSGKIPPMTLVFDLVNNGDYYNTSDFHRLPPIQDTGLKRLTLEELPKFLEEHGVKNE